MTTVSAERDYRSIGQLASHIQRPVRAIEQAATELDITPAMRLNGIPHFDGAQTERLTEHLKGQAR